MAVTEDEQSIYCQIPIFTSKHKSVRKFYWIQMAGNSSEMIAAKLKPQDMKITQHTKHEEHILEICSSCDLQSVIDYQETDCWYIGLL